MNRVRVFRSSSYHSSLRTESSLWFLIQRRLLSALKSIPSSTSKSNAVKIGRPFVGYTSSAKRLPMGKEQSMLPLKELVSNKISGKEVNLIFSHANSSIAYNPGPESVDGEEDDFAELGDLIVNDISSGSNVLHVENRETLESKEGSVPVKSLPMRSTQVDFRDFPVPVAIQISNVSFETVEHTIHMICNYYAPVESLVRSSDGTVTVYFRRKDIPFLGKLFDRLNSTELDGQRWSAKLLRPPKLKYTELGSNLASIKRQLEMKKIYIEDLILLDQSISHLQDCSPMLER